MANIKTTVKEWAKAKEYFEAGLSLSKIVEKTGISKTQISKRSNSQGWAKGTEKEQLVQDAVRVRMAKGTLTEQALAVHNEIVDEKANRLEWLNKVALLNVRQAMESECQSQNDFRSRADTISKAKDVVDGKVGTAIQINTGPQAKPVFESKYLQKIQAQFENE